MITSADGAKRVLQDNVANYSKDHGSYRMLRRLFGNGLITSEGSFWLLASVLGDRPPRPEDFGALPYTRAVVAEALRLHPPVYIINRRVRDNDVICGRRIYKGGAIVISPLLLHRNPAYWEQPDEFLPERRLDAEAEKRRPRFAYIPFSSGPRQCIGNTFSVMEATLVLATLAQRFDPSLLAAQLPRTEYLVVARPEGTVPMRLRARTPAEARSAAGASAVA